MSSGGAPTPSGTLVFINKNWCKNTNVQKSLKLVQVWKFQIVFVVECEVVSVAKTEINVTLQGVSATIIFNIAPVLILLCYGGTPLMGTNISHFSVTRNNL